jgi:hypothetical protein
MIPRGKKAMVKRFATARASAAKLSRGPDQHFAPCWWPKLAGRYVRNSGDPEDGFDTRDQAIDAARRYRASCQTALADT